MTALIDADSIVYIVAWKYRDDENNEYLASIVKASIDLYIKAMLKIVNATAYLGVFSPPTEKVFRTAIYKMAPYKGNRPAKSEWYTKWSEVIKSHLIQEWKFTQIATYVEADDVVAYMHECLGPESSIVLSPDKDLRQIPGLFFNYKHLTSAPVVVTEQEAEFNYYMALLTGDAADNIMGIPGYGEVKAKKVLKECVGWLQYEDAVMKAYTTHFGWHYGLQILEETIKTVHLMTPSHKLYGGHADAVIQSSYRIVEYTQPDTDLDQALATLGWI